MSVTSPASGDKATSAWAQSVASVANNLAKNKQIQNLESTFFWENFPTNLDALSPTGGVTFNATSGAYFLTTAGTGADQQKIYRRIALQNINSNYINGADMWGVERRWDYSFLLDSVANQITYLNYCDYDAVGDCSYLAFKIVNAACYAAIYNPAGTGVEVTYSLGNLSAGTSYRGTILYYPATARALWYLNNVLKKDLTDAVNMPFGNDNGDENVFEAQITESAAAVKVLRIYYNSFFARGARQASALLEL